MHYQIRRTAILIGIASVVIAGCGNDQPQEQHHTANGDLRETTASLEILPSFLDSVSAPVQSAYRTAASITDLLPAIPCYCGCGESAGHTSNLSCFINSIAEDGSIVWDDHGTRCGVCMEIANTVYEMNQNGSTLKEIRQFVDDNYAEGYAAPTPTPMPA